MADTLSYTLRIPSNLKTFLDAEAAKRNMSTAAFVVEACWAHLEEPRHSATQTDTKWASFEVQSGVPDPIPVPSMIVTSKTYPAQPIKHAEKMNPAMAKLLAGVPMASPVEPETILARCAHRDTVPDEAGNYYGCALPAGHKGLHKKGDKVGDIYT